MYCYDLLEKKLNAFPATVYTENGKRVDNITQWGSAAVSNAHYRKEWGKDFDRIYPEGIGAGRRLRVHLRGAARPRSYRYDYATDLLREFPAPAVSITTLTSGRRWARSCSTCTSGSSPPSRIHWSGREDRQGAWQAETQGRQGTRRPSCSTTRPDSPACRRDAWRYRLGNRSALEWVLDQYKERKPKDPTVAERFDTYRFADYKERVIDLLRRVCTVSIRDDGGPSIAWPTGTATTWSCSATAIEHELVDDGGWRSGAKEPEGPGVGGFVVGDVVLAPVPLH